MPRPRRRDLRPLLDALDPRCLLTGLSPIQVTQAYGLNAITFPTAAGTYIGNGTGETIAIVEAYHDPYLASDLHTFDAKYGLSDPTLNVVNQAGSQTNDGWAGEEALDVEWAHAIAPGANIVVVEAASQNKPDLLAAVNTARNIPGVVSVSMSWGFSESSDETQYDGYFTTPAGHTGITFVAASGDSGQGVGSSWPAVSPNVLAVGGSTLFVNSGGVASNETAWSDSQGGYSLYESEPSYQSAIQSTGQRSTPDVAFLGDPNTGVSVYSTTPSTGRGVWQTVGGTSLGSPAWAAIVAIMDEGRAVNGKTSLDGATQTLPALYSVSTSDYNAVAAAPSSNAGFGFGGFGFGLPGFTFAAASTTSGGANTATGLGTPIGSALLADLVAYNPGTSSSSTSTTTTTTTTPTTTTTTTTTTPVVGKHKKVKPVRKIHVRIRAVKQVAVRAKTAVVVHGSLEAVDAAIDQLSA